MSTNTMAPEEAIGAIGKKWWLLLLLGALSIVAGIAALNNPISATATLIMFFGLWLLASGIGSIVRAFGAESEGAGKTMMIISGFLSVALAVIFFNGGIIDKVQLASIFMGITFMFRGMAELMMGIASKGQAGRGWAIFMGIITLIAGVVTINNPVASLVTVTQIISFFLIILGVMEVVSSFQLKKLAS
jgi:uncharacterized membrane protein HdeD (DUF308 family)